MATLRGAVPGVVAICPGSRGSAFRARQKAHPLDGARRHNKTVYGNAESLGVMVGAFGGGALAGTLLYRAVAHRLPRRLTFL
jgi:hypothetical protein